MKNIDYLQINKFSSLHNNSNIFFCKTDFILNDFETISNLNNEVVLITGNSDYAITDKIVEIMPSNIKYWYAQNALSNHNKIKPLPIGIENKYDSLRKGHGISYYDRVSEKEYIINNLPDHSTDKLIYANFNINTNPKYRHTLKQICSDLVYIDWEEPKLTLTNLFHKFLEYRMVLCPIGNGIDTHRLWEVLYCNRIPITIKIGEYKIYELYKQLPIIVLESIDELYDLQLIQTKYDNILNKSYNMSLLNSKYWINNISMSLNMQL